MRTCRDIEPLVTPYVDGEASLEQREAVSRHLEACAPCEVSALAEQAARTVLRARASALAVRAPEDLKARCRAMAPARPVGRVLGFPRRAAWPLALAATLVLAFAGALAYGVVRPTEAAAAQLALDHVKCFALFDQPGALHPATVQAQLHERYGWEVALPDEAHAGGLRLVGGRRCIYLDGTIAHILYKHGNQPVSLFVLPADTPVTEGEVDVLGYAAVAFRRSGRTYVVLAREPKAEVAALAQVFK